MLRRSRYRRRWRGFAVRVEGRPLESYPRAGGQVSYSRLYELAYVAFEYGMTPDAFMRLPGPEQARCIAYIRTRDRIRAVISWLEEHRRRK